VAIFPEDRQVPALECEVVQVKLNELQLERPRQWGACWLALGLWEQLRLDEFWSPRLHTSRQGTRWLAVLKTLPSARAPTIENAISGYVRVFLDDCVSRRRRV
jgi:hypothetical protein